MLLIYALAGMVGALCLTLIGALVLTNIPFIAEYL